MTTQREAFEKFRDGYGYVSDQDRKPTAFETWQAAIEDYKASLVPVAWMHRQGDYFENEQDEYHSIPLYDLGETK